MTESPQPVLSLVTPSFEQRALLAQCLQNVARADPGLEHIVVDGDSQDGTRALLEQRADGERLSFVSDPDAGMYDALARGFGLARADILGWLNCDDLHLPWTVSLVRDVFAQHPEVDVVYGDSMQWHVDADRLSLTVVPPPGGLPHWLAIGGVLPQPTVFFRRELYERVGGIDAGYKLMGDVDLWHRFHRAGARFFKLWEVQAVERMSAGQLSSARRDEMDRERARAAGHDGGTSSLHSAAWRASAAALHRLGLASLLRRGQRSARWRRLRASGFAELDRRALLRALAGRSADVRYAWLSERGAAALLGDDEPR